MVRILTLGLSYKTAPVEIRERLSFSSSDIKDCLKELYSKESIKECCIISTCNRVEIYCVSEQVEKSEKEIISFLSGHSKQIENEFSSYIYKYYDDESVKHLFRVSSSMDSMVVGEPQILGQVKDFYNIAFAQKTLGPLLNRLFHTAFFTAKKVRTETGISSQAVSISYLAVELAKRIFEDLTKRKVMLIGTGEMSQLAARHLLSNGINELFISSRNYENAVNLSNDLNGKPIKIEETLYNLKNIDILITATGSSDYIIKDEDIKQCMKLRKNDPLFLIDIAVPRDIDPKTNDIPGVYLYDIDDLKNLTDENLESRKESLQLAEEIVSKVENNFMNWIDSLKVFPTIIDLKDKFELIKNNEIRKALNKLGETNQSDKEVLESLAHGIVSKIFHEPTTNLKKEASSYEGMIYSEVLNKLFGLDEEKLRLVDDIDDAKDWN